MSQPRVVSLLPSGTEIVAALGFEECLVGRSHECDYPESVLSLPICSQPRVSLHGSSRDIDHQVRATARDALSIYEVRMDELVRLQPTMIITQTQCDVCAIDLETVETALGDGLDSRPRIVALRAQRLSEIWLDIERVAAAFGAQQRGCELVGQLQRRLEQIRAAGVQRDERPRVACIEWLDPLMSAGNWMPELVEIAGGQPVLGRAGEHSPWIKWTDLLAADPEFIIVMPCGFSLARTERELSLLTSHPDWRRLRAVSRGHVFMADGNQYFNRPGPRIVESAEILVEILQLQQLSRRPHPGWCSIGE